jgi:hypothetical protein
METVIEIPDLKRGKGMFLLNGMWHALYYEDGKQRRKYLDTDDEIQAVKLRNRFFLTLKKQGAVTKQKKSRLLKIAENAERYIYRRKPYVVRVGTVHVGDFEIFEEAREARDGYLKGNDKDLARRALDSE